MKRIAQETESAIVDAWRNGARSTTSLASQFGVSAATVRVSLQRNGLGRVPRATFARKTTPEQDAEILALYEQGRSASQIGALYNLEQQSVLNRIHAAGVQPRVRGGGLKPLTQEQVADILRLRSEGVPVRDISQSVGAAYTRVSRCLREHGQPTWSLAKRRGSYRVGGYVKIAIDPDDPMAVMADARGYVPEHRYVMAQSLGRPLDSTETVHHINGDGTDNRLENLQLRQGRHGKHAAFACLDCGSHRIGPVPLKT